MASLIPGYEYDIFISYRQKDNRGERWVSEFVESLKTELESTFKEEISVYFDINPHDGLLETHDVDASLKDKLKCLVFIPIISRTYCDPKSFAWENEFKAFVEQASRDQFGLKVKLLSGNVANRVVPIRIHDLDASDINLCESILGGVLRSIDFVYKEPGVNKPLTADDDDKKNLNSTKYRIQVNKVANAIKEIISAIGQYSPQHEEVQKEVFKPISVPLKSNKKTFIAASILVLVMIVLGFLFIPKLFKSEEEIEKSIAVLPFINDSPDEENAYFFNGIMEETLNNLQTIKDLRVISRPSVEKYRNQTISIPEIARELDVNFIVVGSGQKYGNKVRLRVQLIKVAKERNLWANSYEQEIKDLKDIFRIQSQIAVSITEELKAVVTPKMKELIEKIPTVYLNAYDLCRKGQSFLEPNKLEDLDSALKYFELAKEIDPEFARAYAGISDVYISLRLTGIGDPVEAGHKAIEAAEKALELDSTLAEAHLSMANLKTYILWDWTGGESAFQKAIELKYNFAYAHASYAHLLNILGRPEEALEHGELAIRLDPNSAFFKSLYAMDLLFLRRYDDAIAASYEALKLEPTATVAFLTLTYSLHLTGKYEEAIKTTESLYNRIYKNSVHVFNQGFKKTDYAGAMKLEADTLVAQLKSNYALPTDIAYLYHLAGEEQQTIKWLERAYIERDPNLIYLLLPIYDDLRDEPRFQEITRKMNLPFK